MIHNYLVFAITAGPEHPYSLEAMEVLRIVAPMFPTVMVVTGNVLEFRDMVR